VAKRKVEFLVFVLPKQPFHTYYQLRIPDQMVDQDGVKVVAPNPGGREIGHVRAGHKVPAESVHKPHLEYHLGCGNAVLKTLTVDDSVEGALDPQDGATPDETAAYAGAKAEPGYDSAAGADRETG